MTAGALILTAWLSLIAGFVGGLVLHARMAGVALLTRRFLAETATVAALFGYVFFGLHPTLVALGFGR
jgi:hypothetical protein